MSYSPLFEGIKLINALLYLLKKDKAANVIIANSDHKNICATIYYKQFKSYLTNWTKNENNLLVYRFNFAWNSKDDTHIHIHIF